MYDKQRRKKNKWAKLKAISLEFRVGGGWGGNKMNAWMPTGKRIGHLPFPKVKDPSAKQMQRKTAILKENIAGIEGLQESF